MKRLERIIFVNWYLFDSRQFDLRGDVLVAGANGSGKTSLLDAIQVVALGGHGSHVQLNANASEKGERTIKSYCLGQLSDGEDGNSSVRDDAVTHIGLVFTDEETGESTTVGIAMTAKRSQPKHDVQGLYIVEGLKLGVDDYISSSVEGDTPLSWEQLKQHISHQSKSGSNVEAHIFGKQPEKYVEQLCLTLAPEGRRIDSKKFVQSFRKAVNLKDIVDVSDFVKYYVLEDQPLDIKRLDDSVARYKEMLDAAEAVKKQLESMALVAKSFEKWQKNKTDSLHYEWVEKEYRYIIADSERDKLEGHVAKLTESIKLAESEQKKCSGALTTATKLRDSLKQQLGSDDSEAQAKILDAEIKLIQQNLGEIKKEISNHLSILESIYDLSRTENLSEPLTKLASLAEELLPKDELDVVKWPQDAAKVDSSLLTIKEALDSVIIQTSEDLSRASFEYTTSGDNFKASMKRLAQLEKGGSNVSKNTLVLQEELRNQGIEATPLSELAEITDVSWQRAIEAYLGSNVDLLFVKPEQTEQATKIFRTLNKQRRLHGASVINAKKVQSWTIKVNNNSCANFVKSDNPIVKVFLMQMLNRLIYVNTESELLKEDAAITSDGMLQKGGTIQALRMREELILGKAAREQSVAKLKEKIALDGKELAELETKQRAYRGMVSKLSVVADKVDKRGSVQVLSDRLVACNLKWEGKVKLREGISLKHLDAIKESHEAAHSQVLDFSAQDKKFTASIAADKVRLEGRQAELVKQEIFVKNCGQQRDEIETSESFDMEKVSSKLDTLTSKYSKDEEILEYAVEHKNKSLKLIENLLTTAKRDLYKYAIEFEAEQPKDSATADDLWAWVRSNIKMLEETELAKHEDAARLALGEAEIAFRHDIAFKLRENISNMELRIKELNKSLETRPFSGQEIYQFKYTANKEYKEILRFIEETSRDAQANVGTLFDKDKNVGANLMELIKTDEEKVADYRNYYSYDIIIKNESRKSTSKLSKRIKTASGGENRTPYYVTIGASMAAAYRISEQQHGSGMGLIPLDEAFEKMDYNNFYQAAMYLKDIGLQMFLAAPDDSEMKLSTVVNTVIFLSRNGNTLNSTVKYLKDDASELLLSDNVNTEPLAVAE